MVPLVETRKAPPERQAVDSPGSAAGESYRNVRTSLLFAMRVAKLHCLLVTSAIAGEGKTTTCVNLAGAFGRMGTARDRDRRGSASPARPPRLPHSLVARPVGGPAGTGATRGRGDPPGARRTSTCCPPARFRRTRRSCSARPIFAQVITDLKSEYDLVVLDSAVLLAVPGRAAARRRSRRHVARPQAREASIGARCAGCATICAGRVRACSASSSTRSTRPAACTTRATCTRRTSSRTRRRPKEGSGDLSLDEQGTTRCIPRARTPRLEPHADPGQRRSRARIAAALESDRAVAAGCRLLDDHPRVRPGAARRALSRRARPCSARSPRAKASGG